jgi:predicted nucleic acid-binding protein
VLYFDTSFLVPLILREATSIKVAAFVRTLATEDLAISHWTRVEFSSLLAREIRMGGLVSQAASQADARFEAMIASSFAVFLPGADDYTLAKQFLRRFETGLRAGDALHLAIASGRGAETIYSLDKALIKAGVALGLPMSDGIGAA